MRMVTQKLNPASRRPAQVSGQIKPHGQVWFCELTNPRGQRAFARVAMVAAVALLSVLPLATVLRAACPEIPAQMQAMPGQMQSQPGSLPNGVIASDIIGRLSGDDVSIKGAATFDLENGGSSAVLASGSDVTIRSGKAKISLIEGGEIDICGPAHLSLLKSGHAITLALDYGRVHPTLNSAVSLSIYTPFFVATPVAIGQEPRDLNVGLDVQGEMCVLADRGAVRLEQQFSGQSMLVPQGGQASLTNGQLDPLTNVHPCSCEIPVSSLPVQIGVPGHAPIASAAAAPPPVAPPPAAPVTAEPVYRVDVPPLTFDSTAPAPGPDPDPQTLVLVRESRVQPDAVFQGHVVATPDPAATSANAATVSSPDAPPKKAGPLKRFFGLFRRLAS
jgi:hypothetical protein